MIPAGVIQVVQAAHAVAQAIPVRNVASWENWSPTAVGIWSLLVTILSIVAVMWPKLRRINVDALTGMNMQLLKRVGELEKQMADQRRECEKEQRDLREEWSRERQAMRQQIEGLQRQIISYQVASGQPFPLHLPPETRRMVDKIMNVMSDEQPRHSLLRRRRPRR